MTGVQPVAFVSIEASTRSKPIGARFAAGDLTWRQIVINSLGGAVGQTWAFVVPWSGRAFTADSPTIFHARRWVSGHVADQYLCPAAAFALPLKAKPIAAPSRAAAPGRNRNPDSSFRNLPFLDRPHRWNAYES
jgi:hypothetical protein